MRDEACVEFLRWALPRLDMRWPGFRKVRRQVCKRIARRIEELNLTGVREYRAWLETHPDEWRELDRLCRITISRFHRDRGVFKALERLLPDLAAPAAARGDRELRACSAGCAAGEEPYTLAILWREVLGSRFPDLGLRIVATDADAGMLRRARRGRYQASSLKELPAAWRRRAFERVEDGREPYRIKPPYREGVVWRKQDIREAMPRGPFDLVLCRNLVFTYFDEALQRDCLRRIAARLRRGGFLVIGKHEELPPHDEPIEAADLDLRIYRKT